MTSSTTTKLVSENALRQLRLLSGLIMLSFVASHLANHALALISLETAEYGRRWFSIIWLNPVSSTLFYGSVLTHVTLVLRTVYRRRTLRMPPREAMQIVLGLLIPFLIIEHAVGIRFSRLLFDINTTYEMVIYKLWVRSPVAGLRQSFALLVIWTHGCIGVFFWLRYRSWYNSVSSYLLTAAVLLPVLALLGFADAGRILEISHPEGAAPIVRTERALVGPQPDERQTDSQLSEIVTGMQLAFGGAVGLTFLLRLLRSWRQKSSLIEIRYDHGAAVRFPPGLSLLEASRLGGVPHYSVCGGKGRCSTCRVRIIESDGLLPKPDDIELATLRRIHADEDVRLGCQLRPVHNLQIALLLSPQQQNDIPAETETIRPGREQEIAVLFCDLRSFTSLSEARLPYDIVFLLNRYFAIVGQAVELAGGRLDKFIGDGAMALFGLEGQAEDACRNAMKAAALIVRDIDRLNEELEKEFSVRLRLAIGIHTGPSIVGVMGYGSAKGLTAIGDTVNVASRLETAAKELNACIVISEPAIIQTDAEIKDIESRRIEIRGRKSPMRVFLVSEEDSSRFL